MGVGEKVCVSEGEEGGVWMKILLDDMSCLSPFYGVSGTILKNTFLKNREFSMISSLRKKLTLAKLI